MSGTPDLHHPYDGRMAGPPRGNRGIFVTTVVTNIRTEDSAESATRSRTGIPNGRRLPPPLSMYARRAGRGWNVPCFVTHQCFQVLFGCRSNISMLTRSTPALPLLRLTARKASPINLRLILPVNEWCLIFSGSTIIRLSEFFRSFDSPEIRAECFLTVCRLPVRKSGHCTDSGLSSWFVGLDSPIVGSPFDGRRRKSCHPQDEAVRKGLLLPHTLGFG